MILAILINSVAPVPEFSSQPSQEPTTGPYSELIESTPDPLSQSPQDPLWSNPSICGIPNLISIFQCLGQVKANEVGGACGAHGRGEKGVQGFGGKARRKETTGKTKA
jgi:hypothetical protein